MTIDHGFGAASTGIHPRLSMHVDGDAEPDVERFQPAECLLTHTVQVRLDRVANRVSGIPQWRLAGHHLGEIVDGQQQWLAPMQGDLNPDTLVLRVQPLGQGAKKMCQPGDRHACRVGQMLILVAVGAT